MKISTFLRSGFPVRSPDRNLKIPNLNSRNTLSNIYPSSIFTRGLGISSIQCDSEVTWETSMEENQLVHCITMNFLIYCFSQQTTKGFVGVVIFPTEHLNTEIKNKFMLGSAIIYSILKQLFNNYPLQQFPVINLNDELFYNAINV